MIERKYIFNHIPKTGGISVLALCRRNLAADEISPHLREDQIRRVPKRRWEHFPLIAGHFSIRTQSQFDRSRYSFTWLRHPLRRIISQYTFSKRANSDDQVARKAKELSFPEFVRYFRDSPLFVRNVYTHHLAALDLDTAGEPEDKRRFLNYAKRNLAAFHFVGICEAFNESVRMLCADLGWDPPEQPPHENRSNGDLNIENIDPETRTLLIDRNALDLELYEFGKQLFRIQQASFRSGRAGTRDDAGYVYATRKLQLDGDGGPCAETVERNGFMFYAAPRSLAREATITSCTATPLAVAGDGQALAIDLRFSVQDRIEDLVAGILICDADGNAVFGTNTSIEQCELNAEPGHECGVRATLQYKHACGTYSVTAALASSRRAGYHYHWVDEIITLTLKSSGVVTQDAAEFAGRLQVLAE